MTAATFELADPAGLVDFPPGRYIRTADPREWTVVGEPLRDVGLRETIIGTLERVAGLPGFHDVETLDDARSFPRIRAALTSAHDRLAGCADRHHDPRLLDILIEVGRVQVAVERARTEQNTRRYAATRSALSRLHGIDSIDQMLERAPAELCRCGFDRAFVSRVEESMWWVESVHVTADPDWASEIARVGGTQPTHIDHMLIESEIMRRRAPVLVQDAQDDPRINAAIARASLSRSYVAAPIMPEGRIIGFLHADCYQSSRHVDEDDLAVLWMFAEAFGFAFQRTALSERLREARDEVQRMARGIAAAADDLCTAHTVVGRSWSPEGTAAPPAPVAASLAANTDIHSLLSRREVEVVALMAEGKSNGAIATRLVISEGTVKTHVKHILRKLKASNRAEAVFRYMRLTAVQGGPTTAPGNPPILAS